MIYVLRLSKQKRAKIDRPGYNIYSWGRGELMEKFMPK